MSTIESPDGIRPDVRDMFTVHRVFRREFPSIARLVREVRPGDLRRAAVLGDHLRLVLAGLHMHHTGEDEILWPLLLDRAAPSASLIATMQAQHEGVERLTERVEPLLRAWTAEASPVRGEQLAQLVDDLDAALAEHLTLEEREILPLASRYVTEDEWATLGGHGTDAMTARQLPLMFGSLLEEATPDERRALLAALPAPVRVLMRLVGEPYYRRCISRVRAR